MRAILSRYLALGGLALLVFSCESGAYDEQGAEAKQLAKLFAEIEGLANEKPCEDVSKWSFTPIGHKPCGGPNAYLAYSTEIDTKRFLERVALYDKLQKRFNEKWGVSSDCAVVPAPTGIQCVDGKAQFIYVRDPQTPGDPEDDITDSVDTPNPADSLDIPGPADSLDTPDPADSLSAPDPADSADAAMRSWRSRVFN